MNPKGISPQEARTAIQKGEAILIDVREAMELLEEGTAEPALWLATSEIQSESETAKKFIAALPKDKLIIVYCAAGVRSGRFAAQLMQLGFQSANLGGFYEWTDAGLPIRRMK